MRALFVAFGIGMFCFAGLAGAQQKPPVMGIWQGSFENANAPKFIEARITPWGGNTYRAVFHIGSDVKGAKRYETEHGRAVGPMKDGIAEFQIEGVEGRLLTARVEGEVLKGNLGGKNPFTLNRVWLQSPTLGKQPPPGAVVLMDGKSLDEWRVQPHWVIDGEGAAHIAGSSILTNKQLGTGIYHVEFKCPIMPSDRGQARGNSGVYLQGRYEVQVLDSFGDVPKDNQCGGIYQIATPLVNASLPPGEWQTYDINFRAPQIDANGNKTANARITVHHNGIMIHDDIELPEITGGAISDKEAALGPLLFQDHSDQVRFRNVWVAPLD